MPFREGDTAASTMTAALRVGWALAAGAGAAALVIAGVRRARRLAAVAPDLRSPALLLPMTMCRLTLPAFRLLAARTVRGEVPAGVRITEHRAPGRGNAPSVRLVGFERTVSLRPRAALLWLHGGGFVCGVPEQDMMFLARILNRLDLLIVSVDYRLAPEHPFPAALDDAHAALAWLVDSAADLGVDPVRIAVGGQSAGGGLAAALAQRAVDQGPIVPTFQLFVYPMLNAATGLREQDDTGRFAWTSDSNRFGWRSYLGRAPLHGDHPAYAVPAARTDLGGLPPAWIGVGSLDLFHAEDVDYGRRLGDAGVAADICVVEGAYHGFDAITPDATSSRLFRDSMIESLRLRLRLSSPELGASEQVTARRF